MNMENTIFESSKMILRSIIDSKKQKFIMQNILMNEYELYDNLIHVDHPTNEGNFYSLGEYIYTEQLSEGTNNPSKKNNEGDILVRFDVNLDRVMGINEREIYHLLDLFGDLGGVVEILMYVVKFLFNRFWFNNFLLAQLKALYMVNTKEKGFLTESDKPSNLKMVRKYTIPPDLRQTWVEDKIKNHQIIKISFFKKVILTFMGCSGYC